MPLLEEESQPSTYRDYLQWTDEERWEIIEGSACSMGPAPSRRHQEVSVELVTAIRSRLRHGDCRVYHAPFDVRFLEEGEKDEDARTVVQPDIVVVCDPAKLDDRGCQGAPDWVVEIISPSTASRDYILKTALYEKFGVREYWIVHPFDNIVVVRCLEENNRYSAPQYYDAQARVEVKALPGLCIDFGEIF